MLHCRFNRESLTLILHLFVLYKHIRRVALHKYDPPDLVTNASAAATATEELNEQASAVATTPSKGSDFGASSSPAFEDTTPISMGSPHGQRSPLNYSRNLDFDEGEDSDDDLL